MAKFIEVKASYSCKYLLNIDKLESFRISEDDCVCALVCGEWLELKLDWETLKSMIGDSLIQLNKAEK